jgi:phospholipase/carboxylesterase
MRPGLRVFTRRELLGMGVATIGTSLLSGCIKGIEQPGGSPVSNPTLVSRVTAPKKSVSSGTSVPYSSGLQEALLYVPAGYQSSTASPLVLMLHPEGGSAFSGILLFQKYADAAGLALLAVDSYSSTWDIFAYGYYGPDLAFIDAALSATFNEANVDPSRVAIEGFSDGASYALAMGRTNGLLFSRVICFSPGGVMGYQPSGKPTIFLAQGTNDLTFDITQTGDVINSGLVAQGYTVTYVRFNGGHEVPDAVAQQAIAWLAT